MPEMNKPYWETETPKVIETDRNHLKVYQKSKRIQVFSKVLTSSYKGLSKGVTINLSDMTPSEISAFKTDLNAALNGIV